MNTHQIVKLLQLPFPLINSPRAKWMFVLVPGLFVILFLNIFQPFTIRNQDQSIAFMLILSGYGIIGSIILFFNEFILQKQFPKVFDPIKWTFGKSIAWSLWQVFTLSIGIYAYRTYWCCGWESILSFQLYPTMLFRTLAIGIFPISAMLAWLWIYRLKNTVIHAPVETTITLTSDYHNEQLFLEPSQLLFIEAADNYVAVYYHVNATLEKKLLRSSLGKMEDLLKAHSNFMRCHRSFIINLNQLSLVKGNSKKMEVYLNGHSNAI
ncbi:MAG: LytTR family DNA-binding domain-containing protein, partial [Bacteroidota bacterium]